MHHRHQISTTTHTVEMAQLAELNDGLTKRGSDRPILAEMLGMQGVDLGSGTDDGTGLPGDARLLNLVFDGPPDYPYVHGHFETDLDEHGSSTVGVHTVDLHTDALRKLSRILSLSHVWG